MGLVIVRFQYALPAYAGQITVSDINRIDAIFAKGFKWHLRTKLFKCDDIIKHSDKRLFCAIIKSNPSLNSCCLLGRIIWVEILSKRTWI